MNKLDCDVEKLSSRMIGLLILPFAIALGAIGFLVLPVVGLFFSIPLFLLAITFLVSPDSKVCRLILRQDP